MNGAPRRTEQPLMRSSPGTINELGRCYYFSTDKKIEWSRVSIRGDGQRLSLALGNGTFVISDRQAVEINYKRPLDGLE
jgi:hypothetical protein